MLVHNPSAGVGEHAGNDLLLAIRGAGHEARYCSTKEHGWRSALEEPGELVVVAGGDGTVDKVGVTMAGRGVPLAILPIGTVNNIARALQLREDIDALIAGWSDARRQPFDVGFVHGVPKRRRFLEAVGVGVFPAMMGVADTIEQSSATAREEALRDDLRLFAECLAREQPRHWRVTLDDRDLSGDHLLVEAMNIGCVGPALRIASRADPGDGLLDVVIASAHERHELQEYVMRRLEGDERPPKLPFWRGRKLLVHGPAARTHVDGSFVRKGAGGRRTLAIHVGIWPGALEFLV